MQIEEKFNRARAAVIDVSSPHVSLTTEARIKCEFFAAAGLQDPRSLSMFMTPAEALELAEHLVHQARIQLSKSART